MNFYAFCGQIGQMRPLPSVNIKKLMVKELCRHLTGAAQWFLSNVKGTSRHIRKT